MTRTDRDVNAAAVAVLLGMDTAQTFSDLPAGFRIRWRDIESRNGFADCFTIGDMARVFVSDVLRSLAGPASKAP